MGKDVVRRCREGAGAERRAVAASVGGVRDNVPRDPARDVKPDGRPHYKNDGTNGRASQGTERNSRAEHTSAAENSRPDRLGAGPRALRRRVVQLRAALPSLRAAQLVRQPALRQATDRAARSGAAVAGSGGSAPDAVPSPTRRPASAGWPGDAASAWPSPGRPCYNNELGDRWAERSVRTL
jgi:hypothetical protein